MAVFRNLLAQPIQLEMEIITDEHKERYAISYLIYAPISQIKVPKNVTGGVQVSRKVFGDDAKFSAGKFKNSKFSIVLGEHKRFYQPSEIL